MERTRDRGIIFCLIHVISVMLDALAATQDVLEVSF